MGSIANPSSLPAWALRCLQVPNKDTSLGLLGYTFKNTKPLRKLR